MDLLERYLQAVGRSLPLSTREDTLAELRANLLAQLDAQQETTGHPATSSEVEALLLYHGHPAVVASRYLPQRSLIGPELFPFYKLTLRRGLPLVAFVSVVAYTAASWAESVPAHLSSYAAQALAHLVPVLLTWWAITTAIFGLIEYAKGRFWDGNVAGAWKPSSLPLVEDFPARASWPRRVADFVVHGVLTAYLLATPFHPFLLLGPGAWYFSGLAITLSPPWRTIYLALLCLLVAQLCLKALSLFGSGGQWRWPAELCMKLLGTAVIIWVIRSDFHLVALSGNADTAVLAAVNRAIEVGCKLALVINITAILWSGWNHMQSPQVRGPARLNRDC